jgi:rubrerythrin
MMGFRKLAVGSVLDAEVAPKNGRIPEMWRTAHRVTFEYKPRPGFLYVRSRMISSRCNDNFDEFPGEEIIGNSHQRTASVAEQTGYQTFLGKPVFVNHNNANHRRARGMVSRVALHEDLNRDHTPDIWVEGLMEVDAMRFPMLAHALLRRHIDRTSMGVDVTFSRCAACGNQATTPAEYCRHIPAMKGKKLARADVKAPTGRTSTLIRETCFGLRFFENSLLVEQPADPTAYTLGDVELGPGLEHLSKAASRTDMSRLDQGPRLIRPARESITIQANRLNVEGLGHERGLVQSAEPDNTLRLVAGRRCIECNSIQTVANRRGDTECVDCGAEFHATALAKDAAGPKYPNPGDHPWFQQNPVHHNNIVDHWNKATPDEKTQGKNWYSDAHIIATALGEHHEKTHGDHPHGAAHLGAGIVANYSPQMGWTGNIHNAARVLHENKGIGGKGSGMFASDQQRKAADRMLGGERHEDVLGGPKIQDFAHLIEHGGDRDPQEPRTVIDRHALSVATGKRMSDDDYGSFPKSQRHYYGHVVNQYNEAAKRITASEGEHVAAHQVQAATWLTRQRLNQADEANEQDTNRQRLNKGRERGRERQEKDWDSFRQTHYPEMTHQPPGTGYTKSSAQAGGVDPKVGRQSNADRRDARLHNVAYGETKAPRDVDTLRDENCPVCGETDAWNGDQCPVCGFVQPPKQFQDPDLDKARQVDLRKDNADLDGTDVTDLEAQTNDRDRDGLDDVTGEPIGDEDAAEQAGAFDEQPLLVCPACESEFEASEPQSINTRDPQAGSDSLAGPEEGDVCPACGKAELLSGSEMQELMDAEQPTTGAPDAKPDVPEDESDQEPENLPFGRPQSDEGDDEEEEDEDENPDEDDEDSRPPAKTKGSPFNR